MTDRIGQRLGNYHITRLLGRGGFAEVYLGEHIYLKTPAAVKILHTRLSGQEDLDGFLREAQLIARLIHPNIVRVMDFGIEGDTPFLVMDYASHGTLRQRHPKGTRLPLNIIVPYVKDLAAALQHAHEERLVHRDIKPENILLGRRNEVLLSDFGIALIAQSSRYQSTQDVVGTVAYMSPEQIQGKPRPASDQYSLGIVVYEWLTGDRPFHGSFTELCTQHMFAPVPSLREKIPDISPQVEQVVAIALAKDVKQHFGSIQAFATALEQASQSAEPTTLIPRPEPYTATQLDGPAQPQQIAPTQQITPPLSLLPTQSVATPPTTSQEPIPERQFPISSPIISPLTVEKLALVRTLTGHVRPVASVAISASWDKTIKAWNPPTGRQMRTFKSHRDSVSNVALSTDGQIAASASYDETIKIWDLSAGRVVRTLAGHNGPVYSVAISPDGRTLLSGSGDKTIKIWDLSTGRVMRTLTGHNDLVYCVAISADGRTLLSGSGDKTIKVWRA